MELAAGIERARGLVYLIRGSLFGRAPTCTVHSATYPDTLEEEYLQEIPPMETNKILAELRSERDRVDEAIAAVEALRSTGTPAARRGRPPKSASAPSVAQPTSKMTRGGRRVISVEGRKRIAEAARKRWAAQKKKANVKKA